MERFGGWLPVGRIAVTKQAGRRHQDDATASVAFLPARSAALPPYGAREPCGLYDWACRPPTGQRLTDAQVRTAIAVIRRVNRDVRAITDAAQYGRTEVWALPTRRGGDCEDFALMKKRDLLAAGLPPGRLLLASALDRRGGISCRPDRADRERGSRPIVSPTGPAPATRFC